MKRFLKFGLILALSLLYSTSVFADVNVDYIYNGEVQHFYKPAKVTATGYFVGDNIKHKSQLDTGKYGNVNCGPTCLSMVGSYFDKDIDVTDLNKFILPTDKGYSVTSLEKMLKNYKIPYEWGFCKSTSTGEVPETALVKYIDENHIILLAIDTQYIRTQADLPAASVISSEIGRTYLGSFNHFILCTGYLKIDDVLYYQILDPLENGYSYIPATDIAKAMLDNWTNCFLFKKS